MLVGFFFTWHGFQVMIGQWNPDTRLERYSKKLHLITPHSRSAQQVIHRKKIYIVSFDTFGKGNEK